MEEKKDNILEEQVQTGSMADVDEIMKKYDGASFEDEDLPELAASYLAGLKMKDGSLLYNDRETSHMHDVRVVFQNSRAVMSVMIVFIMITVLLVSRKPAALPGFLKCLTWGSSLTLFLITMVGIGILTGFDAFFEAFHHLFFTGDSWLFYADDSLIRLFPEKLWIDGFSLAAGLTALFAVVILVVSVIFTKKLGKPKTKIH